MAQYILLIQNNIKSDTTTEEWEAFFATAKESGLFKGGSEMGERVVVGDAEAAGPTEHIVGYMRFDSDDKRRILELLQKHPVVMHGGSVVLCEMPRS